MPEPNSQALLDRVLELFVAFWGPGKVAALSGEDVDEFRKQWAIALGPFAATTVGAAVALARESGAAFPPSLPEFLSLCRDARTADARQDQFAQLPAPAQANPAAARRLLDAARAASAEPTAANRLDWARAIVEGKRPNATAIAHQRARQALAEAGQLGAA